MIERLHCNCYHCSMLCVYICRDEIVYVELYSLGGVDGRMYGVPSLAFGVMTMKTCNAHHMILSETSSHSTIYIYTKKRRVVYPIEYTRPVLLGNNNRLYQLLMLELILC